MGILMTPSVCIAISLSFCAQDVVVGGTAEQRVTLERTTRAIRDGFGRGDVGAVAELHHPDVVKYFGGANVVKGRAELERGLKAMFEGSRIEFVDHKLESLLFEGSTAVETSIFTMKVTSKTTRKSNVSRGRAMVVYIQSKESPTGWLSIREMAQAAPPQD